MELTFCSSDSQQLWPLHQDTSQDASGSNQLIAGTTLREQQQIQALSIGDIGGGAPLQATQYENAWITSGDWQKLAQSKLPATLKSRDGDTLAWTGDQPENEITASERSFLIRYPWQFLDVNEQLIGPLKSSKHLGEVSLASHIDGVVHLGAGSRILPGVVIEGNIVIGENCKIGPNCYLRGSTTIGDNCFIGQAVEIKNSIIGHGSAVCHLSYIGDSILGNHVNFGAGTITSNFRHDALNHRSMVKGSLIDTGRQKFGTIVGDGAHTGILTAIYPGRKLGPNTTTRPNDTIQRDLT